MAQAVEAREQLREGRKRKEKERKNKTPSPPPKNKQQNEKQKRQNYNKKLQELVWSHLFVRAALSRGNE